MSSRKASMEIYVATVEDASHLGGPMGSEYTVPIAQKTFTTYDKALKWLEQWNDGEPLGEAVAQSSGTSWGWDIRVYIVHIDKRTVE
jgi:hypothetical protein